MANRAGLSFILCCLWGLCFVGSGCGPDAETGDAQRIEIDGGGWNDDEIPSYPAPYSSEELKEILDEFRWEDTEPVVAEGADGTPKLYYFELLAPSIESTDELEELMIPWDYLPLFDEEFVTDDNEVEVIDIASIEEGRLVYAIFPGEAYNLIREEALNGTPPYPFMRLRTIPPEYRLSDGTLDPEVYIEYLAAFDDLWSYDEVDGGLKTLDLDAERTQRMFLGKIIRGLHRVVRGVADFFREKVIAVRQDRRTLVIDLRLTELDTNFQNANGNAPLMRAWGDEAGRPLYPHGALVGVNTGLGAARTAGRLDTDGFATLRVPDRQVKRFTIDLENHAATIVPPLGVGLRRIRVRITGEERSKNNTELVIKDPHVGVYELAIFTDAYQYSANVLRAFPRRAVVSQTQAFDAAFVLASQYIDRGVLMAYFPVVGAVAYRLASADILILGPDRRDRITLYHEYGHWVLAGILHSSDRGNLSEFWSMTAISALGDGVQADIYGPGHHVARMINEGFADFFSIMTTGGASYGDALAVRGCVDLNDLQRCFEENLGSHEQPYSDMNAGLGRLTDSELYQSLRWGSVGSNGEAGLIRRGASIVSTFFVDLVDGGTEPSFSSGLLWRSDGSPLYKLVRPPRERPWAVHLHDERVALRGLEVASALRAWIREFDAGELLRGGYGALLNDRFAEAFASVASKRFDPLEVCEVFALHTPSRTCPQMGRETVEAWENIEDVQDMKVVVLNTLNDSAPFLLFTWAQLSSRNDEIEIVIRDPEGTTVSRVLLPGTTRFWSLSKELEFDEEYQVEVKVLRHGRSSPGLSMSVVTWAERPYGLVQEQIDPTTIRVSWESKATSYDVVMEYPLAGTSSRRTTARQYIDLTRWDFPYLFQIASRSGVGVLSFDGTERSTSAVLRVVARNQEGVESPRSRERLDVTLEDYPAPQQQMLAVERGLMTADNDDELVNEPIEVQSLSRALGNDGGCEECGYGSDDFSFVLSSAGRWYDCHHSEPEPSSVSGDSLMLWAVFECFDGAELPRYGEMRLSSHGIDEIHWLSHHSVFAPSAQEAP